MKHRLVLPAPWGLGVVLGLKKRAYSADPLPLIRVTIMQVRAKGDFRGAMYELVARAHSRKLVLAELAPWDAFCRPGVVGSAQVTACQPLLDNRGYTLGLADPRPSWQAEAA